MLYYPSDMDREQILVIKLDDKDYPKLLKQIADPPIKLYCRGNIELLNTFCLAVVGTRKLTAYGREAAQHIIAGLSSSGMTIVSGLAMGIDSVAHQSALDNGLPTIAVLGGAVNDEHIGPKTNLPLAKEILNNDGLLISEYSKKDDIRPANFAVRDRIISGISKGVVVVEGAEDSGSLITAKSAVDQNRDVFAVPGSIFSSVSRGTNWLLKNGAKIATSAEDIIEEYSKNPELKLGIKNNISTRYPIQKKILVILDEKGEMTRDEIIRISGIDASQIISALSMLEMNNKIREKNGKYQLNAK